MKRLFLFLFVCATALLAGCFPNYSPQIDQFEYSSLWMQSIDTRYPSPYKLVVGQNDGVRAFALKNNPLPDAVTINATTGVVTISRPPVGVYRISVDLTVTNDKHRSSSSTASFTVTVTGTSAISYNPSTLNVAEGGAASSVAPTLTNASNPSFGFSSNRSGISINSTTGVISVANTTPAGIYGLDVRMLTDGNNYYTTYTVNVIAKPSNLVYNPSSLTLAQGNAGTSATPTVTSIDAPTYGLVSPPTGITINSSTGVISVANSVAVGTYALTVRVTNFAGATDFSNAYTVTVNSPATAPSSLAYSPSSLTLPQGNAGTSATPTIQGTGPFTYSLVSPPSGITINSGTGVISVANSVAAGTYALAVKVINTASPSGVTFNSVYTVTITGSSGPPANLVYNPATLTLTQGTTGNSVTPTIQGTGPMTYSFITNNPPAVNPPAGITIDSNTGVISVANTTAKGTYQLSVQAFGLAPTNFFNVYTVTVQ